MNPADEDTIDRVVVGTDRLTPPAKRLSPLRLAEIRARALYHGTTDEVNECELVAMCDEILQRRAADLTSDEVSRMRWARTIVTAARHSSLMVDHAEHDRIIATLDKIIGAKP